MSERQAEYKFRGAEEREMIDTLKAILKSMESIAASVEVMIAQLNDAESTHEDNQ